MITAFLFPAGPIPWYPYLSLQCRCIIMFIIAAFIGWLKPPPPELSSF